MLSTVLTTALIAAAAVEADPMIPVPLGTPMYSVELQIVKDTNTERVRYGLPKLTVDPALLSTAREQATWMAASQVLQHTRRMVGENIAMGQNNSQQAVTDWMNSPGHRANILHTGYRRIGVAAYVSANGRIYWCQQFLR